MKTLLLLFALFLVGALIYSLVGLFIHLFKYGRKGISRAAKNSIER